MRIASLVVRAKPEHFAELNETLGEIPGVEVHGASAENGRMVLCIEDGEGYSITDSILAVSLAEHVLGATLAYEYTDEGLELLEA
ncbi:chaperone NapD [Azoarcus olearius]|uniref:Chaperone NapD n=1 Tax=Azoarcus sp. (strain BH72) TaxID=418699 RepID=A1KCK3_AZOSB|nr:chaperone NapD [Azoarcus olearius]ANQ87102.1 periplasmic nitrate reductase subunit NapD [Azoarcus olearius]CAL96559.1 probable NapD protein [Azoarcus olearius]